MLTSTQPRLPAHFTSLYRLFLRTCSASVLHKTGANRALRRSFRPVFRVAAQVIHKLESGEVSGTERETLQRWLAIWNTRIDNTLSLLYNSSQSRGLPHKVVRNLASVERSNNRWFVEKYYISHSNWNPDLPEGSYVPPRVRSTPPGQSKEAKANRAKYMEDKALGALGHVVKMAEGQLGVSLGTVKFRTRREPSSQQHSGPIS